MTTECFHNAQLFLLAERKTPFIPTDSTFPRYMKNINLPYAAAAAAAAYDPR